jgi:hypothetical protein
MERTIYLLLTVFAAFLTTHIEVDKDTCKKILVTAGSNGLLKLPGIIPSKGQAISKAFLMQSPLAYKSMLTGKVFSYPKKEQASPVPGLNPGSGDQCYHENFSQPYGEIFYHSIEHGFVLTEPPAKFLDRSFQHHPKP